MNKKIREEIFQLIDEDYKKFSSSLLPNIDNILGVRLPELRKLAKKVAKDDWRKFIDTTDNQYFEQIMLQGMVLGYIKINIEEILLYVAEFIPKIDNWSVCDSFCGGLKFTKNNMEQVWNFIQPFLSSKKEYEVRFAVVMLLDFYINDEYIDKVLKLLDNVNHPGYYAKMAVAWAVSICYIKFPEKTMDYLKNNNLDDFTYNKSLQKICESLRVDKETKKIIKAMRRKL
ncbi:DNA alkylation repair protein [Clostridium tetani]|uniref:DNA alkylation repair protein n=1 Tax=Clostridium tetani TaxID=1513 RepID=A0A4Q0VC96_CLOTA|nr:DNA alkylation repair protein [Clostridium tetani]CDI49537.1 DNA alkylation repair enzyme [Clostridium tetani 12124569]KHO39150.1 DNA alkylation repair protein [Clostridium tetani]RXI49274.1 DNA alkylation repair protein [Clostridium tetani]RXI51209.1 DNA alkylation repair protein [Clostridium tetani]RXI65931.1 DNA alkylation repair protein [Clostridium tetani]